MEYQYDSWKICASRMKRKLVFSSEAQPNLREANFRIQNMTYPDGEEVNYEYNKGGMLQRVKGVKNGTPYPYINDIRYNEFELKESVVYGNGTSVMYDYDQLQTRQPTPKKYIE